MVPPEFWQFLNFGWWTLHMLAVGIVCSLGVAHGRKALLREMKGRRNSPPREA